MTTFQDLQRALASATASRDAAIVELGLALLEGRQSVDLLHECVASAERAVLEAQARCSAWVTWQSRVQAAKTTRLRATRYQPTKAAKEAFHAEVRQFVEDYGKARDKKALVTRGKDLQRRAKLMGRTAADDLQARLNGLGRLPELHSSK